MKLKWTDVERVSWLDKLDDWFMWAVVALMAGATIWIFVKIYQLSRISTYLKSIK